MHFFLLQSQSFQTFPKNLQEFVKVKFNILRVELWM